MTLWICIHLSQKNLPAPLSLEEIATILLQYTPELAIYDEHSLLLEVSASLDLFKGPRRLGTRIRTNLQHAGVQAQIGMAPTALGAWLMTCQDQIRRRRILTMPTLERHLDMLHIHHLPAVHPYLDWLTALGCTTLQGLKHLPRAGLRRRTSHDVLHQLDAAYGKTRLSLNWFQAAEVFHASCQMDFHSTHAHALLQAAQGLIEQLCNWLQLRRQGAVLLQFSLHHEKGRHARPPTCIRLQLSSPSRHAEDFLLLLKEHLQHERLEAPVIAIELHDVHGQVLHEPSGHLFPDRTEQQHEENRLLDLLLARLGPDSILRPDPFASHLPDHANRWCSIRHGTRAATHPGNVSAATAHYPFWMLDQPIRLDITRHEQPLHQGRTLHLIQGPERIESGWWMEGGHEQRDYFVACDNQGCRYWIYRQRSRDDPQWYLHGLFA